jgi:hypothetical protein
VYTSSTTPGFPKVKRMNPYHIFNVKTQHGAVRFNRWYPNTTAPYGGNYRDNGDDGSIFGPMFGLTTTYTPGPNGYNPNDVGHDAPSAQLSVEKAMDAVIAQKVNLAQFIAERQQVANLVADTASKLARTIMDLRRGRFQRALGHLGITRHRGKFTKDLANNWLALQYGWKPLLSDVKGAAEHLARNHFGRQYRLRATGTATGVTPAFSFNYGNQGWGDVILQWSERQTQSKTVFLYEVSNDAMREGRQLGLTDPATLAWELLPWSFVADWFLPIGDYIGRLTFDSGLQYVGGCTTSKSFQTASWLPQSSVWKNQATGAWTDFSGTPTIKEMFRMTRTVHDVRPPGPRFPSWKDPFTPTHVANAIALLRTSVRVR